MIHTIYTLITKILLAFVLLFILSAIFPFLTRAQVVINEISPATSPEWVELYNLGSDPVSLSGYSINFGNDSQIKIFCNNDQIGSNSYRLIVLNASWLNNDGDTVNLLKDSGILDSISYGSGASLQKPSSVQSISRSPDGVNNWIISDTPTQQGDSVSFDCPTPTPNPTTAPTPTPTATPTVAPTPVKTVTPKPTTKPSQSPTSSPEVLGEKTSEPTSTDSPTPTPAPEPKSPLPIVPMVLIGLGIISIGIPFYPVIKKFYLAKFKRYNDSNDKVG